jgi:hypothetical protein
MEDWTHPMEEREHRMVERSLLFVKCRFPGKMQKKQSEDHKKQSEDHKLPSND